MHDPTTPTGDPAQGPATCPYGHPLGPGRVLVGWLPCICPPAQANHNGHRTFQCRVCLEELADRRKVVSYTPPHLPAG